MTVSTPTLGRDQYFALDTRFSGESEYHYALNNVHAFFEGAGDTTRSIRDVLSTHFYPMGITSNVRFDSPISNLGAHVKSLVGEPQSGEKLAQQSGRYEKFRAALNSGELGQRAWVVQARLTPKVDYNEIRDDKTRQDLYAELTASDMARNALIVIRENASGNGYDIFVPTNKNDNLVSHDTVGQSYDRSYNSIVYDASKWTYVANTQDADYKEKLVIAIETTHPDISRASAKSWLDRTLRSQPKPQPTLQIDEPPTREQVASGNPRWGVSRMLAALRPSSRKG